jgi:outer membrane receptor protein involved in Fe transport
MPCSGLRRSGIVLAIAVGGLLPGPAPAGTTGKITGRVLDDEKRPVHAATVVLVGQPLGANTAQDGSYTVLRIPPGTYDVNVRRVGYETLTVRGVSVSADNTTWLDLEIGVAPIEAEELIITAERPPVDLDLTSSMARLDREEIEKLPVQELDDVVNLQAGVVEGHFRGGRIGEVQYQVDGISINNPYDNSASLTLDRSLLQEVQVISGTFDAEYGQAMSGVVNVVLRDGAQEFEWGGEVFGGSFVFPGNGDRLADTELRLGDIQNYQFAVSGPAPFSRTVYLASVRYYHFDDYVYGTRTFVPTDSSDFENKVFAGTGDGDELPLGFSREWSGAIKITNTTLPRTKLSYQALLEKFDGRRPNYAFRLNPDGLSEQHLFAAIHGFDLTQTLSEDSFVEASFRHDYFVYHDYKYEDLFDPGYDAAGPPVGDPTYELGAYVQGVDFGRFEQRTRGIRTKANLVSQLTSAQQVKTGVELHLPRVAFGSPGYLTQTTEDGVLTLVRHVNEPPEFPGPREYRPVILAAFAQNQLEWSDFRLRGGLRLDYFDARAWLPGDLANPANAIAGAPPSQLVKTTKKVSLSPRLGLAYPIGDDAAIHVAYGHFRQYPAIGVMFANADYSVLNDLQAGTVDYGVMGNPDVEPERTTQYEIGYKHALSEDFGVDVTTFYKDIRDLLGVEFISTYNGAEYARLTNVDFGSVFGVTLALDHRHFGPAAVALDYTWQQALGNASDPRETATRASAGEDPRPRLVPFNWDQRHTLNATLSLAEAGPYSASAVLRVASGQPYTPTLESGFGFGLNANSDRKPVGVLLDLRAERELGTWIGSEVSVFGRALNALDETFFNGFVFPSTGSPYYSRFPEADKVSLADPTRFYAPRRIEVGLRFGSAPEPEEEI